MKSLFLAALLLLVPCLSKGMVRVVTTLPDLADLTKQIGGDRVQVDYIVRGDQNPHFVEVKPSYMMKLRSADILLMIGMDLELWAQQIIDGSRNERLMVVDLSRSVQKLEVPGRVDASQGDVHRYGNPHYWLDPRNIPVIMEEIVVALSKASPDDEDFFRTNTAAYTSRLQQRVKAWETLMKPHAGSRVITFHRSWTYFAGWLGLTVADYVEPKPGLQPSPSHTAELIRLIREGKIGVIIVEPFYDTSAADQIARSTGAKVLRLTTSVGGVEQAVDYLSMMEYNVSTLAGAMQ